MTWPMENWYALNEGRVIEGENTYNLSKVHCGSLRLPSGKLVCCDPFADMDQTDNPYVNVPTGEYPVIVTLADVSDDLDGSHIREAYASIVFSNNEEVSRRCLEPTPSGDGKARMASHDEFYGFGVDAGTACFVDAESLTEGMPEADIWYEELFETDEKDCWFNLMDDENIREGIANITLPLTKENNNLILFHSGWGDGYYPVIGGYDKDGNLVAIHIDFFVVKEDI